PAEAAVGSPLLRRVPRVSLERLDLDLSSSSQPPVFRVFPGSSAQDFSLIVIERGAQPPAPPRIKEEPQEAPISTSNPRRFRQLPELPGGGGAGSTGSSCLGSGSDLPAPPLPAPIPAVSCCRVCGQAGAVVMCDCCERCYHLQCHLPALHEVPSPDWRCLLCQELPPGGQDPPPHPPQRLSPAEQRRCEFVLLELLCHEPCRPLQHLSSCLDGVGALDLTLIRARLQGKVGAPYS
ncbi:TIF1B factor, partial [Rhinopomastus cyanomelas]|nr:TIF1B factor [Rhinopomastus cyanomelas]